MCIHFSSSLGRHFLKQSILPCFLIMFKAVVAAVVMAVVTAKAVVAAKAVVTADVVIILLHVKWFQHFLIMQKFVFQFLCFSIRSFQFNLFIWRILELLRTWLPPGRPTRCSFLIALFLTFARKVMPT